jgi:hypothetical protein
MQHIAFWLGNQLKADKSGTAKNQRVAPSRKIKNSAKK